MKIEYGFMGPKGTKKLTMKYRGDFARMSDFYANLRWYNRPGSEWTIYYRKLKKGEDY